MNNIEKGGLFAAAPGIKWPILGIAALNALSGFFGNKQQQQTFSPDAKFGEKPMIQASNPYQSQMQNPMMRRPPMFSSALGRYGGLG